MGPLPDPAHPWPGTTRLFERLCSATVLEAAWDTVRRNAGGPGGDRMETATMAPVAGRMLAHLQHALRGGTYRPGPLRRVTIPKGDGGTRTLAIPCVIDRVAQTAAARVLGVVLEPRFHPASFGYRPGRGVTDAVMLADRLRQNGYAWVVDGDIAAFFDTVPHRHVMGRLERRVADRRFTGLVALWLRDGAAGSGHGLPQGSPLSPLLANLALDPIDWAIDSTDKGTGVRLVRYADDFLLLCEHPWTAVTAKGRMAAFLACAGLRLNPRKTRITSFAHGVRFLGYHLDRTGYRTDEGQ